MLFYASSCWRGRMIRNGRWRCWSGWISLPVGDQTTAGDDYTCQINPLLFRKTLMALRLLRSLFRTAPMTTTGSFDDALIREAIERVVDGTDPRLRAVSHYRRKLRDAVAHSVDYVAQQVATLPPAIEVGRRRFTTDPCLRALFISPDHLREVLSFSQTLHKNPPKASFPSAVSPELYAALSMERFEKTMLGVELQGDLLRRDVPQMTVNFRNHRVAFPTSSETETRREMMKRAFDYLIEAALQSLTATRTRKQQLQQQQRQLLQKKAQVLKRAEPGLEALLANPAPRKAAETAAIERQLREIAAEFSQLHADSATLDHHLAQIVATLRQPERHLRMDRVSLTLNHMNIKVSGDKAKTANTLTFDDALIGANRRMTVLLVHFPRSELLESPDFFDEAQRILYLNGRPRLTTL